MTAAHTAEEACDCRGGAASYLNLLDLLGGDPGYLLDHGVAYVGAAAVAMEGALPLPTILTASLLGHAFFSLSFNVTSHIDALLCASLNILASEKT